MEFDPTYSAAWKLLGKAHEGSGDLAAAQSAWTRGLEAAQAKGDLEVLAERGRRYLRVHIKGGDIDAGLQQIVELVEAAVA